MLNTPLEEMIQSILSDDTNPVSFTFEDMYTLLLDSGETAIIPLMASLQSEDPTQHHIMASILCDILVEMGDDDALELLNQLVYDSRNEIFTPAIRAIAQFRLPQIDQILCELLDHPAAQVRRVVAWQLGRNQAVGVFSILVSHLDEVDLETLRGIIWSLGRIGDYRSVRLIEPFTKHLSADIAFIAEDAIRYINNNSRHS